jgi:hypothetical protein
MYKIFLKSFFSIILILTIFTPIFSFADTINDASLIKEGKITNPISYNNINDFIKAILRGAIKIGIPIIALAIIYSGFLFVSARGNSEKLSEAKNALLYTCLGAAILLGAWAIAQLISETILAL